MATEFDCQHNHQRCIAPACACPREKLEPKAHCEECGYNYNSCWAECPQCQQSKDKNNEN